MVKRMAESVDNPMSSRERGASQSLSYIACVGAEYVTIENILPPQKERAKRVEQRLPDLIHHCHMRHARMHSSRCVATHSERGMAIAARTLKMYGCRDATSVAMLDS